MIIQRSSFFILIIGKLSSCIKSANYSPGTVNINVKSNNRMFFQGKKQQLNKYIKLYFTMLNFLAVIALTWIKKKTKVYKYQVLGTLTNLQIIKLFNCNFSPFPFFFQKTTILIINGVGASLIKRKRH